MLLLFFNHRLDLLGKLGAFKIRHRGVSLVSGTTTDGVTSVTAWSETEGCRVLVLGRDVTYRLRARHISVGSNGLSGCRLR